MRDLGIVGVDGLDVFHPADPQGTGALREIYPDFQSSLTSFRECADGSLNHRFRAYTTQLQTLGQLKANNQYRKDNQIEST